QAEDGIRYRNVTGVQTCALPICRSPRGHPTGRSLRRRMIRRSMTEQNPKSSDDTPAEAGLGEATPAEAGRAQMAIDVVSIFPDYLAGLQLSLIGKAVDRGQLSLNVHDLRDLPFDRHDAVGDWPYGGGAGMVMKGEPWPLALEHILTDRAGDCAQIADPADRRAEATEDPAGAKPTLIVPSPA